MTLTEIATLINLLAPLLVFLASFISHKIYASLKPDHQQVVSRIAEMVIPAIEQTCQMFTGEEKRQEAVRQIEAILRGVGLKNVSPVLINAAIEAAVWSLKK